MISDSVQRDLGSIAGFRRAAAFPFAPATATAFRPAIGLLELLVRRPISSARPSEAYSLAGHGRMLVDFGNDRVHAGVSARELIEGGFQITPARWDAALEDQARRRLPGFGLRDLLWSAVHRLGREDAHATALCDALPGRFRLLHWPDAAALRRQGYPLLAAALTNRPLDIAAASEASGVSANGVRWFIELSLSLGIAEAIDGRDPAGAADAVPFAVPASGALRSALGRLRERFNYR